MQWHLSARILCCLYKVLLYVFLVFVRLFVVLLENVCAVIVKFISHVECFLDFRLSLVRDYWHVSFFLPFLLSFLLFVCAIYRIDHDCGRGNPSFRFFRAVANVLRSCSYLTLLFFLLRVLIFLGLLVFRRNLLAGDFRELFLKVFLLLVEIVTLRALID